MNELINGSERQCPVCGKRYLITCRFDEWGFGYGRTLLCSYHCMRDFERRRENMRKRLIGMNEAALEINRQERDREIVRRYKAGMTMNAISVYLGCGHETVRTVLRRNGVTFDSVRSARDAAIIDMHKAGLSARKIATELGISDRTVQNVLRREEIA